MTSATKRLLIATGIGGGFAYLLGTVGVAMFAGDPRLTVYFANEYLTTVVFVGAGLGAGIEYLRKMRD